MLKTKYQEQKNQMTHGRTIRIYLQDGTMSGIRHAEIVNWTGQGISVPRTHVKALAHWSEATRPGIYFLLGINKASHHPAVYIGEGENVFDRLSSHLLGRDFWNEAVFFSNKDENLTKAHVKYLESRLVRMAKAAARYSVENLNDPPATGLPRGDRDSMEEFIGYLTVIVATFGHHFLEPPAKADAQAPEVTPAPSRMRAGRADLYWAPK
jgi:hypothetical protein